MEILYKILFKPKRKREYQPPPLQDPKVILDIGANIGAASIWLADLYPNAKIYSFEPLPENFAILKRNAESRRNIHPLNIALGSENGTQQLFASDNPINLGGCSLYQAGTNPEQQTLVSVRSPQSVFEELKIQKVDLVKIDTEGAEYDILTSFNDQTLQNICRKSPNSME